MPKHLSEIHWNRKINLPFPMQEVPHKASRNRRTNITIAQPLNFKNKAAPIDYSACSYRYMQDCALTTVATCVFLHEIWMENQDDQYLVLITLHTYLYPTTGHNHSITETFRFNPHNDPPPRTICLISTGEPKILGIMFSWLTDFYLKLTRTNLRIHWKKETIPK